MSSCCCELTYLQSLTWRFPILKWSYTCVHNSSRLILAQQGCLAISASATGVKCWSCQTLLFHLTTASIFPLNLLLLHSATPISSAHPAHTPAAHVQSGQELSSGHRFALGWIVLHNPMQDFAAHASTPCYCLCLILSVLSYPWWTPQPSGPHTDFFSVVPAT